MTINIGIKKALPSHIVELAIILYLEGKYDEEYIREQVSTVYEGKDIIPRCVNNIRKIVCESPLDAFMQERKEEILNAMRYKSDKGVIITALLCASFPIAYDTLFTFGKYFQVQEFVNTDLLRRSISNKYGSNWSLDKGLYAVIPTFIDSGLIIRPKTGLYASCDKIQLKTQVAWEMYCLAYIHNNTLTEIGEETLYDPYFSFCGVL